MILLTIYFFYFQGTLERIPSGFVHEEILVAGEGLQSTMYKWGDLLLRKHGKQVASLSCLASD